MAFSSLFALIDDVAAALDDVSVMVKVASKKTAGVLGDDLALNAQQVSGVDASRELPVVWAVAKGSLINKIILVPAALLISYAIPWLVTPLLMCGGAYLCVEGFEEIWHQYKHANNGYAHGPTQNELESTEQTPVVGDLAISIQTSKNAANDAILLEASKIKGAIRTDFILSAEIVVIALGSLAQYSFAMQVMALSLIALLMTVGVYGLVAGVVKMDDGALLLMQCQGRRIDKRIIRQLGFGIVVAVPYLMRGLSILGTAAMFLVGGGIIAHAFPVLHHLSERLGYWRLPSELLLGMLIGAMCLLLWQGVLWRILNHKNMR